MSDKKLILARLKECLEAMLAEREKITARAVLLRMDGLLKHASDITRNPERGPLFKEYKDRQNDFRASASSVDEQSSSASSAHSAASQFEIEQLKSDRELLVASHRGLILSMAELGGASVWLKFFEGYKAAIDRLEHLGALPSAVVNIDGTDRA